MSARAQALQVAKTTYKCALALGLEVHAWLDSEAYEKDRKVSDQELSEVRIKRNKFHGEWNYEVHPRPKPSIR
ncbi:ISAzo13-like element transposase-related protein [Singulisphaera acidiphila]|uniref:ISAzo13-like element transposase-related protein n=1 Tax=Singulisphaera acidiphila TaxID=466153 RepID=UPI0009DAA072